MKKVVKFVPVVTIVLVIINVIVTLVDFRSAGMFNSDSSQFVAHDVTSNFSHVDWDHLRGNMTHLLIIGSIIEVLLSIRGRRVLYVAIFVLSIIGNTVLGEVLRVGGIGASGWLASFPVIAVPIIVWFAGTGKYRYGDYSHPVWAALAVPVFNLAVGLHWDISSLNSGDGINHEAHLIGYGFGAILFLVAAPFAVRAWVRTFARVRAQRHAIIVRRAEYRRKIEAQRAAAMVA